MEDICLLHILCYNMLFLLTKNRKKAYFICISVGAVIFESGESCNNEKMFYRHLFY